MKEGSFDGAECARKGREDGDGKNFPLLSPPLAYAQKRGGGGRRKGEEIFPTTTSEASADFLTGPSSSSSDVKKARRRQGSHKAVKYLKTAYSVVLHVLNMGLV